MIEQFIGCSSGHPNDTARAVIDKATDGRATVLALGVALAAAEAATGTHSWRRQSPHRPLPDLPRGQRVHPLPRRRTRRRTHQEAPQEVAPSPPDSPLTTP